MNWKEFLKPDKRKIVLTAFWIIILIILKTLVFSYSCMFCDVVISAFILNLITSYLLSCLVVWIHDKKVLRNWAWIIVVFIIIVFIFSILYFLFCCGGLGSSLTSPTIPATELSVMAMQFRIEDAKYYTDGWVNATIRNIGVVNFDVGKLAVYVDGVLSIYAPNATGNYLSPGQTITLNITNGKAACSKVLVITLESGLQDSRTISC